MAERRLYAKFTLDYADSHKIAPLSDAAFRAHVRMILWSRRMLTDGKIPGAMAKVFARPRILVELTTNDAENPSLVKVGDDYWLHDFTQHQSTREEVEAIQKQNRSNGSRGGQARAKRMASESLSEPVAKSNTETETQRETATTSRASVQAALEHDFDEWWKLFPRKQGKADAFKAYKAARKTVDAQTLEKAVSAYLLANVGQDKNFLKMPAGWLRGERWADDQIASVPLPARKGAGMCVLHPEYPMPCDKCARGGNPF